MENKLLNKVLPYVGWTFNIRYTSEDISILVDFCNEIETLHIQSKLNLDVRQDYALKIYNIISFQLLSVQESADLMSNVYVNSTHLKCILELLDEAYLSFYRGYYTGALSVLFIALEKYLRSIYGWKPGDKNPTFLELKNCIRHLPEPESAQLAKTIVDNIYSKYDSLNPNDFYFNRHSLLHGLYRKSDFDEMNCARLFNLFSIFAKAEGIKKKTYGENMEMFKIRHTIFRDCTRNKNEQMLLNINVIQGSR